MRRTVLIPTLVVLTSGLAFAVQHPYRDGWAHRTASKRSALRVGLSATTAHIVNSPHEWGRGAAGFGKRLGSAAGAHVVKTSVEYAVGGLRHEDLRYHRSNEHGFGPRLRYALVSTVVTRKTTTGKKTVASGRISGNLAAGLVSRAWQPVRLRTVSSGFSSAGISFGVDAGSNVVQEFWPEIRHPHRH